MYGEGGATKPPTLRVPAANVEEAVAVVATASVAMSLARKGCTIVEVVEEGAAFPFDTAAGGGGGSCNAAPSQLELAGGTDDEEALVGGAAVVPVSSASGFGKVKCPSWTCC